MSLPPPDSGGSSGSPDSLPPDSSPVDEAAVGRSLAGLRHLGAGPGKRLALQVHPDRHGVAAVLAAARTGATISLLHPRWTRAETSRVLASFQPHVYVPATDDMAPTDVGLDTRLVPVAMVSRQVRDVPATRQDTEGLRARWVLWSSGTTGRARGLVLDDAALEASGRAVARRMGLGPGDRWLATLSPAHVGGLALIFRSRWPGSQVVPLSRFEAGEVNRQMDQGAVTHLSLVPTQLLRLLEDRQDAPFPETVKGILVGGAPTPPALLRRALDAGAPVALTWGMTELGSQVATAEPARVRARPGGVGPPLPGVEVRIDQARGPVLGEGIPSGELLVRGPTLATGTWVGPGQTPVPLPLEDGWFRTGDVGRLDARGELTITGRIADRIITGGVNVEPAEVEAALLELPWVREAAVVGMPDPEWGQRVVAVVAPLGAEGAEGAPGLGELREALADRLQPAKRPRELVVVRALPRRPNGKVDREALRQLAGG